MEEDAMIYREKKGKKVKKVNTKKLSSTKTLNDINFPFIQPLKSSSDFQKRGCFRFLNSKSHPQTPKSTPPTSKSNHSSKPIPKNRSKTLSNNPQNLILKNPRKLTGGKIAKQDPIFKPKIGSFCSGVKEGKDDINCMPPIQASISPEVRSGFSVTPSPVCFATGRVVAGVEDRRKCRPRGILTIGEEKGDSSHVSSEPPLVEASVCWFSSPLKKGAYCSKVRTFDVSAEEAYVDCVLRTPTSNSSVSPFSAIVRRAEASSWLQVLNFQKEKGMYIYGDALDVSPFSEKSWSDSGGVSTPSSYTNSRINGVISPLEIDSAVEDLGAMRLTTKLVLGNNQNESFKFGCQPAPTLLNSIDLNCFKSSRYDELSKVEIREKNLSVSGARISWREGLLSRMFEMGDLDSYQSFFDDDENFDHARDGNVKFESGFKFALNKGSLEFEKGNGFGSYEFPFDGERIGVQKCQSKTSHLESNSFAESISTEGGLMSSGDSDWTLFYKNNLFEV